MTTVTLRGTKGSPLTNAEVDANFNNLNSYKVEQTSTTGSAYLPSGTTAQRTGSSVAGEVRYNTSTQKFEGYGSAWGNLGGGAAIGDTAPSNPGTGDLWWNSLDGHLYVYYGSIWVDAFAGGEGQYLPLTGGTVSGKVVLQNVGGAFELKQSATGAATYYVFDNTVETGGKRWRFGYTGAAGTSVGQFAIYNQTDNTLGWVLDASGNLGLGVTPSGWGTSGSAYKAFQYGASGFLSGRTGNEVLYLGSNAYQNGTNWIYALSGNYSTLYQQDTGYHRWYTAASGTAGNPITFGDSKMVLDASGNLLVGKTTSTITNAAIQSNTGIFGSPSVSTGGLQIVASVTGINDNSARTIGSNDLVNGAGNIIITSSAGVTVIPVYPNGGGGIAFTWTYLTPGTGTWSYGAGFSISFTQAGTGGNTYTVALSSGAGILTVTRTAGSLSYSVYVQKFVGL